MKICVLDAVTLGIDIDWNPLRSLGELTVYQNTAPDEIAARIADQEIVLTNKVVLQETNLSSATQLKLIAIMATGTNNVDLQYTAKRNIVVCNVAGYSTDSVAQHTFAMLFYLLEHLPFYDNYVKAGGYAASAIFTNLDRPFWLLKNKRWGIIGMGSIGRTVAKLANAFGCEVVYFSTSGQNHQQSYTELPLSDLLQTSDIVSVHAPLNNNTYHLLGVNELQQMKTGAVLLNLGRGGIVDELALKNALEREWLAAAGLDVLEHEPILTQNPLLQINCPEKLLITPHIAWSSREARNQLLQELKLNIEAFLAGQPRNVVA